MVKYNTIPKGLFGWISKLRKVAQNKAPNIFDPYSTFKGGLGYYGNSTVQRFYNTIARNLGLNINGQMPELLRLEKDGINPERFMSRIQTVNSGRFPWINTTTDRAVTSHSGGNWNGSPMVIIDSKLFNPSLYLSTEPSDTFILGKGSVTSPNLFTLISGNPEELNKARELGWETLSSPEAREAYYKLKHRTPLNTGKMRLDREERSQEALDYTNAINKLLWKRGRPTYADYKVQASQTGLPLTVFKTIPEYSYKLRFGKNPDGTVTKMKGDYGNVYYNSSATLESELRRLLGIPASGGGKDLKEELIKKANSDLLGVTKNNRFSFETDPARNGYVIYDKESKDFVDASVYLEALKNLFKMKPLQILKLIEEGRIKLRLPSHTDVKPREFVIDPQGNNRFRIHMRTWDGEGVPALLSNDEKNLLFESVYNELPEGAEILVPKSHPGYYAHRGTVAGMKRLERDSRFRPGKPGSFEYRDKDGSLKKYEGTSFIKLSDLEN